MGETACGGTDFLPLSFRARQQLNGRFRRWAPTPALKPRRMRCLEQVELEEGKPYFNAMRKKENRERKDWIKKSKAIEFFRSAVIGV